MNFEIWDGVVGRAVRYRKDGVILRFCSGISPVDYNYYLFIEGKTVFMSKGQSLQDPFLNTLRKERIPVSIYLVNGIKLQGQVESFDQFVILLKNNVNQMVYKHAISTVVPAKAVAISDDDAVPQVPDSKEK